MVDHDDVTDCQFGSDLQFVIRDINTKVCTTSIYGIGLCTFDISHFCSLRGMIPFHAHSNSTVGNFGLVRRSDRSLVFVTALLSAPRSRAASHTCRMSTRGWKLDPGSRRLRSPRASLRMSLQCCFSHMSNKIFSKPYFISVCSNVKSDNS